MKTRTERCVTHFCSLTTRDRQSQLFRCWVDLKCKPHSLLVMLDMHCFDSEAPAFHIRYMQYAMIIDECEILKCTAWSGRLLGKKCLKDSKANHEEESPEASVSLRLTTTTTTKDFENWEQLLRHSLLYCHPLDDLGLVLAVDRPGPACPLIRRKFW